jgi:trimeric autotransporter adhesin
MKKKLRFNNFLQILLVLAFLGLGHLGFGQTPVPMLSQSGNTYSENFSDIANWTNNFAAGVGANRWASYPITTGGTANDGKRTTKSSASFSTSSAGGVQKGTGNLVFLSTGSGATSEAVAVDLLLDFTGVNAGTLSFDWSAIDNGNGTRPTSLRVYWSIDNSTFTELTTAQILDVVSSSTGTISSIALPSAFNNASTARIRFYNHAGSVTGSGNRDKIAIDNITVTSTAGNSAPTASGVGVIGTADVGEILTGMYTYADNENNPQGTSIFKWYRADNASGLNEIAISGATSSSYTLTIDDLNKFV